MKKKNQIPRLTLKKLTISSLNNLDGKQLDAVIGGGETSVRMHCPIACQTGGSGCGTLDTRFIDCKSQIPDRC